MKIAITGASGFVGQALARFLRREQHQVIGFSRRAEPSEADYPWDPAKDLLDPEPLEGCDALVHLAGENIARRWTADVKRAIRDSRTQSTGLLCRTLAGLSQPPRLLISASAIGYYGAQRPEPVDEESAPGKGFLADVCQAWEGATATATKAGIPTIHLRIGVVLSPDGGALAKMLPPFKAGLGGPVGSGKQHLSWITLTDLVRLIAFLIPAPGNSPILTGPVNAVAPEPVSNAAFAQTLGQALARPTLIPTPAIALRLAFGEMANETVLADQQVYSRKIPATAFAFQHPELAEALKSML